uniref:Chemokine interleukin-8-like domain-containing protein n=1 Tax=Phasianus colchicus TaxID=9054 RepID=A0A669QFR3_PHACC
SDQPTAPAMSARLLLPLLLSAVVASSALPAAGAPPAGELRCRCVRAVAERIPPRHLVQVELIPEGPHCAVPEVIATTKQGHTLCLSPSVPWVKLIQAVQLIADKRLQRENTILTLFLNASYVYPCGLHLHSA